MTSAYLETSIEARREVGVLPVALGPAELDIPTPGIQGKNGNPLS